MKEKFYLVRFRMWGDPVARTDIFNPKKGPEQLWTPLLNNKSEDLFTDYAFYGKMPAKSIRNYCIRVGNFPRESLFVVNEDELKRIFLAVELSDETFNITHT